MRIFSKNIRFRSNLSSHVFFFIFGQKDEFLEHFEVGNFLEKKRKNGPIFPVLEQIYAHPEVP